MIGAWLVEEEAGDTRERMLKRCPSFPLIGCQNGGLPPSTRNTCVHHGCAGRSCGNCPSVFSMEGSARVSILAIADVNTSIASFVIQRPT